MKEILAPAEVTTTEVMTVLEPVEVMMVLEPTEVTTTEVMTVLVPTEVMTVLVPTEVTTTATKAANGSTERLPWG